MNLIAKAIQSKPPKYWDDLRFPASAINPPGLESDPTIDTNDGTFLFDASSTEILFFVAQMPHAWAEGTYIVPHVHWSKTTSAAGTVAWKLEYKLASVGGTFASSFTSLGEKTTAIGDTDEARKHLITELGEIDMTGQKISCVLLFKLSRVGGSDTYGANAKFYEFDLHYQSDGIGSEEEFVK